MLRIANLQCRALDHQKCFANGVMPCHAALGPHALQEACILSSWRREGGELLLCASILQTMPTCDNGHLALELVSALVAVTDEDGLGFLPTTNRK